MDASGYATRGVLLQKRDDDLWHPVAFRSASMSAPERNYEIYDREMLAVIEALEDWKHYLAGTTEPFEIITDHENLQWWSKAQDLSRRQARWALRLSEYNFTLTHRPGKANTQADALSRMSHHCVHDYEDNRQQTVLKPRHFARISANVVDDTPVNELEQEIRRSSKREAEVLEGLKELKRGGLQRLAGGLPQWEEDDGLVYHRGRVYVPPEGDLRKRVLRQCHDTPTAGHGGNHSTFALVSSHYWWPGMRAFVQKYVEGCDECVRKKHHRHPRSVMTPLDVPAQLWETVGVDLITQLPPLGPYDAILTCVDLYSKMVHAIPCTTKIDADGIAELYQREIFRLHGLPLSIVSDRGPQFSASLMQKLLTRLGIRSNMTSGYHPQANGQTERANQEIEKYLRLYVHQRQTDWADHIPTAEFVINSRVASAHGMSPFEVVYGYQPHFNIPVGTRTGVADVDERVRLMQEVRKDVTAGLEETKRRMKAQFEEGKRTAHQFKVGDLVYLDSKDIKIHVPTRKLAPTFLGPYHIEEKIGDLDYKLALPISMSRLHPTFHVDKLVPWLGNTINGERPPEPGPVELDDEEKENEDEERWEVEEITNSRKSGRKFQYWVKWVGYGSEAEGWQDKENIFAPNLVAEFHAKFPNAPKPPPEKPPPAPRKRRAKKPAPARQEGTRKSTRLRREEEEDA